MKLKNILAAGALAITSLFAITSCGDNGGNSEVTEENETLTLIGINISTKDVKSDFYIGENFSSDGLAVTGIFLNQKGITVKKNVTGYTVDSNQFNNAQTGTYEIHIIYQEGNSVRTGSYEVNVKSILAENQVVYVKGIKASGMNLDYNYMEELDKTGLSVEAIMSDGKTKDITNDNKLTIDTSDYDKTRKGNYELKFAYTDTYTLDGKSETRTVDTFLIAKVDATLTSIALNESSTTTFSQYTTGDAGNTTSVDTSTWTATATYENGQTETIYAEDLIVDYTGSSFDSETPGTYLLNVTYTWGDVTESDIALIEITKFVQPDFELKISSMQNVTNSSSSIEPAGNPLSITQGVTIEENGKTYGAQYTFTKRLKLNANGTLDSHSIKIDVENPTGAKIVVYAISSSSSEERPLGLYNSDADEMDAIMVQGANLQKLEFVVNEAGVYYVYGTAGAVNIYYVAMWNN